MCDACGFDDVISRRAFMKRVAAAGSLLVGGKYLFSDTLKAAGRPIRIGAPHPLSGPAAALGHHSLWGLRAALRDIERQGGIAGRPVELLAEDDSGEPAEAVRIMRRMILRDQVDVIIGGSSSAETIPMLPVARDLQTPLLITVAESDVITADQCNRFTFRLTPDVRHKANAFVPFLVNEVEKDWTFVYWDNAWGQAIVKFFGERLEQLGGRIVDTIGIPAGTIDFPSYMARLKPPSESPGLFHAVAAADAVRLGNYIGEFGLQSRYKIAGTCDVIFPETFAEQAPDLEGSYVVEQYLAQPVGPMATPEDAHFRELFEAESGGVAPGPHSFASFQWAYAFKRAVESSGYETRRDAMKIIETLEGMEGPQGMEAPQGPFKIRAEDHQGLLNLYIWQLRQGRIEFIKTVDAEQSYYPVPESCNMV